MYMRCPDSNDSHHSENDAKTRGKLHNGKKLHNSACLKPLPQELEDRIPWEDFSLVASRG